MDFPGLHQLFSWETSEKPQGWVWVKKGGTDPGD